MGKKLRCIQKHWDGIRIFYEGDETAYFEGYNPLMFKVVKDIIDEIEETIPDTSEKKPPLSQMNKEELLEEAHSLGLQVDDDMTNKELREKITEAKNK
jgi:hypothetical protein